MLPGNIDLYKSLFHGREDIFAIRWEKNGKSGYFPAYDFDPYQFRLHKIKGGTIQPYPDKQLSGQADSVDHLELGYICRRLKELSRELDLPILAVSQLNRTVEYRGGTRQPELTDLRDSGHIELEADKVLMLYRPEYYHIDVDEEGNSTKYLAELSLQRNQTGKNGYVYLKRDQEFTRFSELPFTVQLKNDIQADRIVPDLH